MANEENLKGHGFHERSANELREIAQRGGRASGEARRKKADFRKTLNTLLTTKIDHPEWTPILEALGLESTLESAMLAAQIREAMSGNTKAAYFVAQYAGQSDQTAADDEEQRIRTDRSRRARDQEVGNEDNADGIKSFLNAMRPTQEELDSLYADQDSEYEEDDDNGEKEE